MHQVRTYLDLRSEIDGDQLFIGGLQRDQLRHIRAFDEAELWREDDCYNMGNWLAQRLGITVSEGMRRTHAAHALEKLPFSPRLSKRGSCRSKEGNPTRSALMALLAAQFG